MRLVSTVAMLLRRIRVEWWAAAFLFALVGVTSFAAAATPRLVNAAIDDGLRHELRRATPAQRNLQFTAQDQIRTGRDDDPLAAVEARGGALVDDLPASVRDLVTAQHVVVETPRFDLLEPPAGPTVISMRVQDGLDDRIAWQEGRPPAAIPGDRIPEDEFRFEVGLSSRVAAEIGVAVGDVLPVTVQADDPLMATATGVDGPVSLVVTGLFDVLDPTDPAWFGDVGLDRVVDIGTPDSPLLRAVGVFGPGAYAAHARFPGALAYRWQAIVDPERFDVGRLAAISTDLRALESTFNRVTGDPSAVIYRSGLLGLIDRFADQRTSTEATLAVAAIGPLVVAIASIGLVAVVIIGRRRAALALVRGRGTSAGQILAAQLWEGILIVGPAAVLGYLLAVALVAARPSSMSALGALVVAIGSVVLLLVASLPLARGPLRDLDRDDLAVDRVSPRRLVFEGLIVVVALAAGLLLRERGLESRAGEGFDPLLAAAPVLVGIAAALLTYRLYPLPVRALSRIAARRRDLVPVLGLRSIARHATSSAVPLLVLIVTVAIGVFASVVAVSVERGQVLAAWREVGADVRVDASAAALPSADALSSTPGFVAGALAIDDPDAGMALDSTGSRSLVHLLVVDGEAYRSVVAGSPVASVTDLLDDLRPEGTVDGSSEAPIPAIAKDGVRYSGHTLAVGDLIRITIEGQPLTYRIAAVADAFPGLSPDRPFVVADLPTTARAHHLGRLRPTAALIHGGPETVAALKDSIAAGAGTGADGPTVIARDDVFARMRSAPLVTAVDLGFLLALGVAVAYAGLAVAAALVLTAERRSRDIAFLRTLGVTERQVAGLTVVEQGLPVLLALVVGSILGVVLASLLAPGLGLGAFIERGVELHVEADWAAIAAVGVVVGVVVLLVVITSVLVARHLDLGRALRVGDA